MPHSVTSLSAILDDLRAPLQNILGKKVRAYEWAQKSSLKGGGKQVLQPIITADDTGMGWIADGGNIAAAAGGDPQELTIPYRYFGGRFRVTGPTEAAAGEAASQLEDAVQFAMEQFVRSAGSRLNADVWSGGRTVGFLNEHKNPGGGATWEFSGDVAKLQALLTAAGGPVNFDFIRMDTYATVATVAVSAIGAVTHLATLDANLNTTAVAAGFAIAVRTSAAAVGATNLALEPAGIYENLAAATHFGIDRTTAAGTVLLQSNVLTMASSGGHDRSDIALRRIQALIDRIQTRTRGEGRPNRGFFHPSQQEVFSALFQQNTVINVDAQSGEREVDAGFTGFKYGGIKFEADVDCGRGMLVLVHDETWKQYEMKAGDWKRDDSGNISYVVQGADAREAIWTYYQNFASYGPNFSGAIVGINADGLTLA